MMRRFVVLAPLAVVVVVAGCGGGSTKKQSTGAAQTSTPAAPSQTQSTAAPSSGSALAVSEMEYKLSPASPSLTRSGTVTITARNDGSIAHALEVEGGGAGGKDARTADIQPGQSATLTLDLKPGKKYEMYCPIDGHKGMGMKGEIVVARSGGAVAAGQSMTTSTQSSGGSTSGGSSSGGSTSGGSTSGSGGY